MNLTRFPGPRAEDEYCNCATCDFRNYYTLFDDNGLCPDCADAQKEREMSPSGMFEISDGV